MGAKANAIRTLYRANRIDIIGVRNAVEKGIITVEEFKLITGFDY